MELIRTFKELGKDDAALAGGKGASLGEMTRAGIPVPPGFVILSSAFEKFLEETDLHQEIEAILRTVDTREMHTVEHASEKIQQLILAAQMPEDIAAEIKKQFAALGAQYVAVRSSATAEDSASAAWAGQLDSFLNTDETSLLKNVQRCWASLFTPRAIFYRFEKELHLAKISVAVVVQKMVESDCSGIAFSVHPVTEDRNQLIIEAGFGLGEAVVSGQITPDSYVAEKMPRRIIDTNVSTQTRALYRAAAGGNEWRDIAEPKASSQVLTPEQILELAGIVIRIENRYGFPCDIEWALESAHSTSSGQGKFYIVQSRPITTLSENPLGDAATTFSPEDYHYIGLYKCSLFAQSFWVAWYSPELAEEINLGGGTGGYFGFCGGHASFHNLTLRKREDLIREKAHKKDIAFFDTIIARANEEFKSGLEFVHSLASDARVSKEIFEQIVAHGQRMLFFWSLGWQLGDRASRILVKEAKKVGIPEGSITEYIDPPRTPLVEQQAEARRLKEVLMERGIWEVLKVNPNGAIAMIQESPDLAEAFSSHLRTYGWIETFNWMGGGLTIKQLLSQMTFLKDDEKVVRTPPNPLTIYTQIASRAGYLNQAGAEYHSMYESAALPYLTSVAKSKSITYRDMLNLLPREIFDESETAESLGEKIKKRTNDNWFMYRGADDLVHVIDDRETIGKLRARLMPAHDSDSSASVKGQIGNKGKAVGPVRVIIAADDFHKLQEGDVLVTPMTTPDFVLLMQKSAAIVTDMGGLLCHAAIVSRELGKPCVIDTKFATQALKDGDLVEVDANKGIVIILEKVHE